jgi:hypothetical protein
VIEEWLRRRSPTRVCEARRLTAKQRVDALSVWVHSPLVSRKGIRLPGLYATVGFELVESAAHGSFGADLVGETWTLGV